MDKLLGSLDTLLWDRPGSTEDPPPRSGLAGPGPRRCWKDTEEMPLLTHHYRPGVCRAWRDPTGSQRERHLNVGQGGSPVPDPSATPHSVPTCHGLGASKWSSWLAWAFIVNQLCLPPYGLSPEAHSGSQGWFRKPPPAPCLSAGPPPLPRYCSRGAPSPSLCLLCT